MIRRPPRSTLFPYTNALPICYALIEPRDDGSIALARAAAGVRVPGLVVGDMPVDLAAAAIVQWLAKQDRKSTRLNSSHLVISYAVFCLKKKKTECRRHLGRGC